MLLRVADCNPCNQPLQCPVCKSRIQLEGPRSGPYQHHPYKLTRASPCMTLTSFTKAM
ncbi:hypothetical protein FOQG_19126 [Fusarium oxysporum f. sp. raphani 54005]|uniref:Uncharacterized protein n=1 Tax=Fusarium oxysporum f. sp. raphani 54005 TaxID=1089458 RepID=X0B1X0_FUSOX|nr:hypothetical protein FOQG_19126 [Fusarium oxysporum f. sp. raphani 54005]